MKKKVEQEGKAKRQTEKKKRQVGGKKGTLVIFLSYHAGINSEETLCFSITPSRSVLPGDRLYWESSIRWRTQSNHTAKMGPRSRRDQTSPSPRTLPEIVTARYRGLVSPRACRLFPRGGKASEQDGAPNLEDWWPPPTLDRVSSAGAAVAKTRATAVWAC